MYVRPQQHLHLLRNPHPHPNRQDVLAPRGTCRDTTNSWHLRGQGKRPVLVLVYVPVVVGAGRGGGSKTVGFRWLGGVGI